MVPVPHSLRLYCELCADVIERNHTVSALIQRMIGLPPAHPQRCDAYTIHARYHRLIRFKSHTCRSHNLLRAAARSWIDHHKIRVISDRSTRPSVTSFRLDILGADEPGHRRDPAVDGAVRSSFRGTAISRPSAMNRIATLLLLCALPLG